MKKKITLIFIFAVSFVALIWCYISFVHILGNCFWWECVPERSFHVLDWELPASLFPDGAIVGRIDVPSEGSGEIESGIQTIFWDAGKGVASYQIRRYATVAKATKDFEDEKHSLSEATWTPLDTLSFSSASADSIYIVCGNWIGYRCTFVARYQEYVVFFNPMIDEKMTYVYFEKALRYIDEQISTRLYP